MIILSHQGIGDHIICNGLVRFLCEKHGKITIPVLKAHQLIEYMYSDNDDISIINMGDEEKYIRHLRKLDPNEYLITGYENFTESFKVGQMHFDEGFYHFAGVDFKHRFDKFYIKRNLEEEDRIYKTLVNPGEKYIFLHDEKSLGHIIDRDKVRKDLKIIENDKDINLFNYRKLFENATEIHVMQSGIFDFINSIPLPKPSIHVHMYVRGYSDWYWTSGINKRIQVK